MISESTNFLLKTNANSEVDVKNKCVKNSCKEFDVANFERFDFLLIEYENDLDSAMKLKVKFHFRT